MSCSLAEGIGSATTVDDPSADAARCHLCGAANPATPSVEDGKAFCCYGCSAVYRFFGPGVIDSRSDAANAAPSADQPGAEAFLRIDGMHCASCEVMIERCAERVDGILSVTTNYATATAKVIYDPHRIDESALPRALSIAGYRARMRGESAVEEDDTAAFLRLTFGIGLAGSVMMLYLAFFYPVNLGLVPESEFEPVAWLAYYVAPRAMLLLTTLQILYVGAPIFRGAWIGLRTGMLNMDDLLAVAILAAYGYSVVQLSVGSTDLYFDVASVIVAVVTAGRYVEQSARKSATRELTRLLDAWRPRARTRRAGETVELDLNELRPADRVLVYAGEQIPVDGLVSHGLGAVDEALLTGEPFPVAKQPGARVLGGTRLVEGELEIDVGPEVSSRARDLAHILWNVQSSGAGLQGLADRVARVFVPAVALLAVLVTGGLLLGGAFAQVALLAGLTTLIVSCPCTFGLAIPLTTAHAVGTALRRGIMMTSADVFSGSPDFDIVAIDKTGTLSTGQMQVTRVLGPATAIARAAAVERLSNHPIAQSIGRLDQSASATGLQLYPGLGAAATVDGLTVAVGGRALFARLGWHIPPALARDAAHALPPDAVVSYVGWDGKAQGAVVTRDRQRPEWEAVIRRLRRGRRLVLLTGAERPGAYADLADECHAGIPPEAKAAIVRRLRSQGRVVMIGDGSNDAPALAAADLGIAFGAATPLAAEAADVVIPGDRLGRLFGALTLLGQTRLRVRQNLGWALLYNAVAIPLAVGGLLNPLFAAVAMTTSSLLVVWNSSRPLNMPERTDTLQ